VHYYRGFRDAIANLYPDIGIDKTKFHNWPVDPGKFILSFSSFKIMFSHRSCLSLLYDKNIMLSVLFLFFFFVSILL
jgi:hypothetical protein